MSTIEREVYIQASPAAVTAALTGSRWSAAVDIRPEGTGARVMIRADAAPRELSDALEMAILDDVCAAKRQLEPSTGAQPDVAVGKSM